MKPYCLFLLIVALPFIAASQPFLDSVNSCPIIGDSYAQAIANHMSQGNSGANQTWNFSVLTNTVVASPCNVEDVTSTPYSSEFYNANLAFNSNNTLYYYMFASSSAQQFLGSNYDNLTYTDPIDELRFPFTYGSSYVDTSRAIGISPGTDSIYRRGVHTATADAYGTLIMPHYSVNALRIKMYTVYKDSIFQGPLAGTVTYKTITTYQWRAEGAHFPLALVNIAAGSSFEFLDVLPVDLKNSKQITNYTLFPNPLKDQICINFENSPIDGKAILKDLQGKELRSFELLDKVNKLSMEGVAKGIYFLEIWSGGDQSVKKIIKAED